MFKRYFKHFILVNSLNMCDGQCVEYNLEIYVSQTEYIYIHRGHEKTFRTLEFSAPIMRNNLLIHGCLSIKTNLPSVPAKNSCM